MVQFRSVHECKMYISSWGKSFSEKALNKTEQKEKTPIYFFSLKLTTNLELIVSRLCLGRIPPSRTPPEPRLSVCAI